jgi:hypothetical protein
MQGLCALLQRLAGLVCKPLQKCGAPFDKAQDRLRDGAARLLRAIGKVLWHKEGPAHAEERRRRVSKHVGFFTGRLDLQAAAVNRYFAFSS